MTIQRICTIYFSPTGTTEKIVKTIGDRLISLYAQDGSRQSTGESRQFPRPIESLNYDFTVPARRQGFPALNSDDLVVFGMPTYAGRLPNLLLPYLNSVQGNGAIAVPIVTFGNRSFDNSLIELRNILEKNNFHTIAAGAFSCEHSFSYKLGKGRPDDSDLALAKKFAELVHNKVENIGKVCHPMPVISVDGSADAGYYQPRDRAGTFIDIRKVKPLTNDKCIRCGLCAELCPMGAISHDDFSTITGKCIKCCSCYKRCPVSAKYFDDPGFLYHKHELEAMYGSRRSENKIYI